MARKIPKPARDKDPQTYETLYPLEYKPKDFKGPLPHDDRIMHIDWIIAEEITEENVIIFGPKAIRWDVLEFIPNTIRKNDFYIIEITAPLGEDRIKLKHKKIYRWSARRNSWLRIAKGGLNR